MTRAEWQESFQSQLAEFSAAALDLEIDLIAAVAPWRLAASFAEQLILCMSLDDARRLMRRDREGTRAFARLATGLYEQMQSDEELDLFEDVPGPANHFHVLSAAVILFARRAFQEFPDLE